MKNKATFLLLGSLLLSLMVVGQSQHKILELKLKAGEFFKEKNYLKAEEFYRKIDNLAPEEPTHYYPLAVSLLNLHRKDEALKYFVLAKNSDIEHGNTLNYYLGKAYQLEYQFDSSIVYYKTYLQGLTDLEKNNHDLLDEIRYEMSCCVNAKKHLKDSSNIEVINFSPVINSKYPEYGMLFTADEKTVIFTSGREGTTGGRRDEIDGMYYEDIYISHLKDSTWSEPEKIDNRINTKNHDASVALSHDGHKMIFYRYSMDALFHKSGDLYITEYVKGRWSKPDHLESGINSKGWEPSACFSLDDERLFFSSNREGGFGGTDLYVIEKVRDGSWGKPENLGPLINTDKNEDAPYLHPDGETFYFASEGHGSVGGYDIYKTTIEDEHGLLFSAPENLGFPINTPDDDLDFHVSPNGKRVYFADNRDEGLGDKDIWYVNLDYEETNMYLLHGFVFDSVEFSNHRRGVIGSKREPLNAEIQIEAVNSPKRIERITSTNLSQEGKYQILLNEGYQYKVSFNAKGHKPFEVLIDTRTLKGYHDKKKNVLLQKY